MAHRFQTGDMVRLNRNPRYFSVSDGVYEITGRLPSENGDPSYRVRNASERHDRVVKESDLVRDESGSAE